MWKWKVNFQIEPKTNQWSSRRWPHDHQKVTCRWLQDSLSSGGDRQEPQRSPLSLLTIVGGASAENLDISRGNRPVAEQSPGGSRQAPAGWLYDMVEGQENRPMSCRSQKIGIRQKSTGHRAIYVLLGRRLYLKDILLINTNEKVLGKSGFWAILCNGIGLVKQYLV